MKPAKLTLRHASRSWITGLETIEITSSCGPPGSCRVTRDRRQGCDMPSIIATVEWQDECAHALRSLRRFVHSRVRLRLSSRRLAVWSGRGGMVGCRPSTLVQAGLSPFVSAPFTLPEPRAPARSPAGVQPTPAVGFAPTRCRISLPSPPPQPNQAMRSRFSTRQAPRPSPPRCPMASLREHSQTKRTFASPSL
jgi:hypothetical protein